MAHMRDRSEHCKRCGQVATITANLDTGRVTEFRHPPKCVNPSRCIDRIKQGVFDRQFGEKLITPGKHLG